MGKSGAAIQHFEKAIELRPTYAHAFNNLGIAQNEQEQLDKAISSFKRAIELNPAFAAAHNNLGRVFEITGQTDEALACFKRAIGSNPNYGEAHCNLGYLLMRGGDFANGMVENEWRFRQEKTPVEISQHNSPRWAGEDLKGKTLLVLAEQGLGDQIQFIRYVTHLHDFGAKLVVECQKPLFDLFQSLETEAQILAKGDKLPPADYHCPLLSLPRILAEDPTQPYATPYLTADETLVDAWRTRLEPLTGFRVGITWQGNPRYLRDRSRSVPLKHFGVLADIDGVTLVSLQKGDEGVSQIPAFAEHHALADIEKMVAHDSNIMDAAAAIMNMDLVITSCTSIAHLAGALGVPTWVMLDSTGDWRWLQGRDDSPWYPSIRLYRRQVRGDWRGPFDCAAKDLAILAANKKSGNQA